MTLRALAAQERRAYALSLYGAWHAAAFSGMHELPDLGPLLARVSRGANQEAKEQLAEARRIAVSFGVPLDRETTP